MARRRNTIRLQQRDLIDISPEFGITPAAAAAIVQRRRLEAEGEDFQRRMTGR